MGDRRGKKRLKVHYPCLREAPQALLVGVPRVNRAVLCSTSQLFSAGCSLDAGTGCIWRQGQQPALAGDRSRSIKVANQEMVLHNTIPQCQHLKPVETRPAPAQQEWELLQGHKPKESTGTRPKCPRTAPLLLSAPLRVISTY